MTSVCNVISHVNTCSDSSPKYMDKNEKQLFADNYKRMIDNSYLNVD